VEIIKVENIHNPNLKDLEIFEDGKALEIVYAGVGDVHWMFHSEDDMSFEIAGEKNYQLYKMFSDLYDDIMSYESDSKEERIPIEDGKVKWYSDDGTIEEVEGVQLADSVEIIKEDGKVILNFDCRSRRSAMREGFVNIRFRNIGSRYDYPYNTFFTEHYNKIEYLDAEEHQVELDEFLFEQGHNK